MIVRGLPAIAPLRETVKTNQDVEIVRRAERCLKSIEEVPAAALSAAAARVIARGNPDGGAEALLAFLPVADDETVADEIRDSLAAIGVKSGKSNPALVQGLDSKEPLTRGAAGEALIRAGDTSARRLIDDPDPDVRLRVTLAAVQHLKDKNAVSNLINLLADGPAAKIWRVEDLLLRIADDSAPQVTSGRDDAVRKKCRDAWKAWWAANSEKIDLAKIDRVPELLGLTMILENDAENVTGRRLRGERQERRAMEHRGPEDAARCGNRRQGPRLDRGIR